MRVSCLRFASLTLASATVMMMSCGQATTESTATTSSSEKSDAAKANADDTPEVTKVAATTVVAQDEEWGTIKGRIVVTGDVPEPEVYDPAGKDPDVCGADDDMVSRKRVVSEDGGLKNAVLLLAMSSRSKQEPEVHPSYKEKAEDKVVVDNVNCMFEPHVVFARSSQTLVAKNSDSKGHNVQNNSRVNPFNPLIPAKSEDEVELEGPDKLPSTLTCNIHPWMKGYLVVRDEPYVAITDKDGNFEIKNMPEGEWKFQFWHETCGYMADLEKDGEAVMEGRPSTVTLTVKNGEVLDLGELTIAADSLSD